VLNAACAKLLFAYKRINTGNARFGFVGVPAPKVDVPVPAIQMGEAGQLFDGRGLFDGRMRDRFWRLHDGNGAPARLFP
jgi:hypothetical protein